MVGPRTLLAGLVLLIAPFSAAQTAPPAVPPGPYGAFAIDTVSGEFGYSYNRETQDAAQRVALWNCGGPEHPNCIIVEEFKGPGLCGVAVRPFGEAASRRPYFGVATRCAGGVAPEAETQALGRCQDREETSVRCEVVVSFCNPGLGPICQVADLDAPATRFAARR